MNRDLLVYQTPDGARYQQNKTVIWCMWDTRDETSFLYTAPLFTAIDLPLNWCIIPCE